MKADLETEEILKQLLLTKSSECPFRGKILHINQDELINLAILNKILHLLFHFTNCKQCLKTVDSKFISRLIKMKFTLGFRNRLLNEEKKMLVLIARNLHINLIFFKDNPKPTGHDRLRISDDIDALIAHKDAQKLLLAYKNRGYRIKKDLTKEMTFISPKNNLSIDIHWLIAYPHFGYLRSFRTRQIQKLSDEMINVRPTKNINHTVDIPYYLILLLVIFWYNDLGFGVYSLYSFLTVLLNCSDSDMEKVILLCRRYNMSTLFGFIMYLAFNYFNITIPRRLKTRFKIPNKALILLPYFLTNFVVTRHKIKEWYLEKKQITGLYVDFYLMDLILDEKVSFNRLLRPRILLLYLKSFYTNLLSTFVLLI